MPNFIKVYVYFVIAIIWAVAAVRIAKAEDSITYAPPACHLTASQARELTVGTCAGDATCTAQVLLATCRGEAPKASVRWGGAVSK